MSKCSQGFHLINSGVGGDCENFVLIRDVFPGMGVENTLIN